MRLPRKTDLWLPGYLAWRARRPSLDPARPVNVYLAITDHFEPYYAGSDDETARRRVRRWQERWPGIAARHSDSTGAPPKHTFFYAQEEYRPWLLDPLAELTGQGIADVEIHLHHDGEGEQDFMDRMASFREMLWQRHGLLRRHEGRVVFGFIHGNWALDNSRSDGRMCGLNNEITLLKQLGCYADFTLPANGSDAQSRTVNEIYWATDDPARPKSYDTGVPFRRASREGGDLLMIPGPLGFRWRERLLPRIECGEIACYDRATPYRFARWLELSPRLDNDIFITLYTHGTQERHAFLLEDGLEDLYSIAEGECAKRGYALHYVSAWQLFRAVNGGTLRAELSSSSVRQAAR